MNPTLILASTSPYRAALLARLGLPFNAVAPKVDETPQEGETPAQLASRLSLAKAQAVAIQYSDSLVIGSDQVAELDGSALGKPGSRARAIEQLRDMSGRKLVFHSGLALLDARDGSFQVLTIPTTVEFRALTPEWIEQYVEREPAFDCAGSAKAEGLGISLMQRIQSDDPTALIGLPLIALTHMLAQRGVHVLGAQS